MPDLRAEVYGTARPLPMEALASIPRRREGPAERTRRAVYATGNKWAIENFNATHG